MNSSEFRVQSSAWKDQDPPPKAFVGSSRFFKPRTPNCLLRTSLGFSYIALLVAIVIIGISLGAAGKYWQNVMLRDKEEELLFRGDQYRQAIELYAAESKIKPPQQPQYPQSIDDLLMDNRTAAGKRHLRQKYKDPMTGEDFVEIRDSKSKALVGVYSPSAKEPLKKDNFSPDYKDLAGKTRYSEWLFIARAKAGQQPLVVQLSGAEQPQTVVQQQDTGQQPVAAQPLVPGQPVGAQPQVPGTPPVTAQPQVPAQPAFIVQPQDTSQPSSAGQPLPGGRPSRIHPRPFTNYPLPDQSP
jgi:type II secretory pathway pseudopilin PulG